MKKNITAWTLVFGTLAFASPLAFSAQQIDSVQFKFIDNQSVVEISGSELASFAKKENSNPPQLVLTFNDTSVAEAAMRKLDTSSFKSNVLQVSAYPLKGASNQARVVIDFKKNTRYTIDETTGSVLVKVDDQGATQPIADADDTDSVQTSSSASEKESDTVADAEGSITPAQKDAISTVMDSQSQKKFTGSPISLKLKDADVHEVLRMIGEASGFNVVVHPSVQGKLTLSLEQVPWDQALDVVLTTLSLGAERSNSVLRVMPRTMLLAEKQQEIDAKKITAAAAPRITRVFPVSYSELGPLSQLLRSFIDSQGAGASIGGQATTILIDNNTQSLVVRDTLENIERIKKMIQILDVQTPQVMIEAKVVEAGSTFGKTMDGAFGIGGNRYQFGANGGANNLAGLPIANLGGTPGGGGFAGSEMVMLGNAAIRLDATLRLAEKQSTAKVVSSPRNVVLSGKSATINQSKSVGIQVQVPASATSPATTQIQQVTANTRLTVTPRVTNDGSVFMKLDMNRDILNLDNPNAPAAEPRQLSTEVIVDSGNTLVIGGVLNIDETHSEAGLPFFRKLPLVGWLFGSESDSQVKTELMFFVTPRILNQRKNVNFSSTNVDSSSKNL